MNPGTILCDPGFKFQDGTITKKYLIVLSTCSNGVCIVVTTTSRQHFRNKNKGCQLQDRYQNFFLPGGGYSFFPVDTWIVLNLFHELNSTLLLQKKFAGEIRHIGDLSNEDAIAILNCAENSDDISHFQLQEIKLAKEKCNS